MNEEVFSLPMFRQLCMGMIVGAFLMYIMRASIVYVPMPVYAPPEKDK